MSDLPALLVAEDDETDILFMQRAFRKAGISNPIEFTPDGMALIDKLSELRQQPGAKLPAVVLLDMKMPRRNGLQVVEWLRSQTILRSLPVIILSSSANHSDIENAYEAGANAFLMKPASSAERMTVACFIKEWLRLVQPPLAAGEDVKAATTFRAARLTR